MPIISLFLILPITDLLSEDSNQLPIPLITISLDRVCMPLNLILLQVMEGLEVVKV